MIRVKPQHGYILLPVVILLTLVAMVAFTLNHESALDSGITASNLEVRQAEQLAKSGLAHTSWAVQNSGCIGDMAMTAVPLGSNSYTATVDSAAATVTQYTLSPGRDAFVDESSPSANDGISAELKVMEPAAGGQQRALMRFDLSAIPAGTRVSSATVWFYQTLHNDSAPVTVHRVTESWTEADATWNSIGTRFDSTVFGVISRQSASGIWVPVNLTALVQSWVNDPGSNHGIMLIGTPDALITQFASREYSTTSARPYLQVTTAVGDVSPVQLTATGTLKGSPSPARDITRKLTRNDLQAHQPATEARLQLQPGSGKDAMLSYWYDTKNYGDHRLRVVSSSSSPRHSLVQFDLAAVPFGARVMSAELQLYHTINETPGADAGINVHRVSRDWVEGTQSGTGTADGATWLYWDGSNTWSNAGGDYDQAAVASSPITDATGDWESWDITALVQGWLDGSFANNGLLLKGTGTVAVSFASKEDIDPTLHPRLDVTYACECGSPCMAPQGSGAVLMVVVNPTTLVPRDAWKKALFESWGYTVAVVGESANQSAYDAALATADVVFISETVNSIQVGTKLQGVDIGVVSQDGIYNDDLGIASGSAFTVASAINVTDSSHYISALFPLGPLQIYDGPMEQLTVSGSVAPGAQPLADTGGAGSLVVLDTGAMGTGGTPLAGRRVMLPLGRDNNMDWSYLNANGRLLVQRALQWGTGNVGVPQPKLLLVFAGTVPTTEEQLRIDLIESWGYTVTLIDDDEIQASFDAAVAVNDVVYVSSTVNDAALGIKLKNAPVGVVNEHGQLVNEFGFGLSNVNYKTRNEIDVIDNTHYITDPFATGLLTIVSADQTLQFMTSNKGPGFVALAQVFNTGSLWDDGLGVIETGGELFGGGTAAGRRVLLPWGDATFDVTALNADGLTLMQRAIEWAEGAGSGPTPSYNVLLVVGNATTLSSKDTGYKALIESWDHTVTLIDDGDSQANFDTAMAAADVIYISGSSSGPSLLDKLTNTTKGLVNEVNGKIDNFGFSSVTSSTVMTDSFTKTNAAHYITEPFSGNPVTVFTSSLTNPVPGGTLAPDLQNVAEVSGTLALGTLDTGAIRYDSNPSPGRRAHLPFTSAETTGMTADGKTVLQRSLEWAAGEDSAGGSGGGDPLPADCDGTYRDEFGLQQYSQNDGTLTWATNWEETGETTDPTGGDIFIANDTSNYQLVVRDDGQTVMREADLSGAGSATLSFDYRRENLINSSDYVAVEVSYNGGTDWAELDRFTGTATDTAYTSTSYVLDPLSLSANTRIRFLTPNGGMGNSNMVWFDNIQIQCSP